MTILSEEAETKKSFFAFLLWKLGNEEREDYKKRLIGIMDTIESEIIRIELEEFTKEQNHKIQKLLENKVELDTELSKVNFSLSRPLGKLGGKKLNFKRKNLLSEIILIQDNISEINGEGYYPEFDIKPKKKNYPIKEYDAYCIDNVGYEEEFDLNVAYIAESDEIGLIDFDGLVSVCGKFGEMCMLNYERFKIVEVNEEEG